MNEDLNLQLEFLSKFRIIFKNRRLSNLKSVHRDSEGK